MASVFPASAAVVDTNQKTEASSTAAVGGSVNAASAAGSGIGAATAKAVAEAIEKAWAYNQSQGITRSPHYHRLDRQKLDNWCTICKVRSCRFVCAVCRYRDPGYTECIDCHQKSGSLCTDSVPTYAANLRVGVGI